MTNTPAKNPRVAIMLITETGPMMKVTDEDPQTVLSEIMKTHKILRIESVTPMDKNDARFMRPPVYNTL